MGILNVTPDSFSDGGRYLDGADALSQGLAMAADGADIVDVGGESTRPGADPVDESTEMARVLPVVEALAAHVRVSIDTTKPAVARAAVAAGATLINDVSASLYPVAAETGTAWVAMHRKGDPRTMQDSPTYDDVVGEVAAYLAERATEARDAGVAEVWIDPGIGFAKTFEHNWALLAGLDRICEQGFAVAVGTSRKAFLGAAAAAADGTARPAGPDDRLEGSVATAVLAARSGARMVRVHDVAATVAGLRAAGSDEGPAATADDDHMETTTWQ